MGDATHGRPGREAPARHASHLKRWRGEARRFLRTHGDALSRRPFWVFSSGPVGDPAEDDKAWTEPRRTIAQAERLGARGHVVFGGRAPTDGWAARAMAHKTPPEYRDRRDWDAIRRWAQGIASELRPAVAAS